MKNTESSGDNETGGYYKTIKLAGRLSRFDDELMFNVLLTSEGMMTPYGNCGLDCLWNSSLFVYDSTPRNIGVISKGLVRKLKEIPRGGSW